MNLGSLLHASCLARRIAAGVVLSLAPAEARQDRPPGPVWDLDEIVVTPTAGPAPAFDAPYAVETVTAEEIERRAYRTLPQALRDVPGVLVQETSQGQGSPYIRGFTGYHDLLLIDGVRLNNSVFRSGPNQYWNTVDPFSIEQLEVVKGPSSVLYGSDAMGGTVNVLTRDPWAYGAPHVGGALEYRGATAADYDIFRAEGSASSPADGWGVLLGGTWKDFGNVEAGGSTGEQPNTGYDEWDADLKIVHRIDQDVRLVLAHQEVHQDDVPRTHSTIFAIPFEGTDVGSDLQRDLDQDRRLSYVQLHAEGLDGFFDSSVTSVSFQQQDEEQDRVRGNGQRELQGFDVDTLGLFQHFRSPSPIGRLTYGFEYYHDDVGSYLERFENQTPADDIQGPVADDATYDLFGIFVQDEIDVTQRLELVLGARYNYAAADADSVRDPVTDSRTSIDDDWSTTVGSARFRYELEPGTWNLYGGVSQGFRAPNLSDLTRFDSARSNEFEVPSTDLDPEYTTSYEIGVKRRGERLAIQTALFYTDIRDLILRFPTGNVNGSGDFEVAKANVGDGYDWGVELGASYRLHEDWTLFGNTTWMEGEVDTYPTSTQTEEREYLDRLMPFTIQLGVGWEPTDLPVWAEMMGTYADDADRLSTRDEGDTQRIPPGGTPSYAILDLRGGYRVNRNLSFEVALENVTDEDYRVHGSGSNSPGRNFVFGARLSF